MRPLLKDLVRRTPVLGGLGSEAVYWYRRWRAGGGTPRALFTYLARHRAWGGNESASGPGSDPDQTGRLVAELPGLLSEFGVQTLLDLPCGDFHWMRRVDLRGVRYTGGDIVEELILQNQQYRAPGVAFEVLDLLSGPLPR
ncbi:MAG TPA: hypothetical protein VH092_03680, partial [Urbifossiella sp.]|nr:hypothetical protein [Urbifossiella sp.]